MNSATANELLTLWKTQNEDSTASDRVLDLIFVYGLEDKAGGTLAILSTITDISGEWQAPVGGALILNDLSLTVANVTGTTGQITGAYIMS